MVLHRKDRVSEYVNMLKIFTILFISDNIEGLVIFGDIGVETELYITS